VVRGFLLRLPGCLISVSPVARSGHANAIISITLVQKGRQAQTQLLRAIAQSENAQRNFPMWAITSYYNPIRYKRRLATYRTFREKLGIPLLTVELSYDGHFELTKSDADILIQISGGAVVWQKERLLNLAIESVPPDVRSIAWLDCDVIFERSDWMDEAEKKLEAVNLVQLFSDIVDLDPEDHEPAIDRRDVPPSGQGVVSLVSDGRCDIAELLEQVAQARSKCVGFAWAARRDILEKHGLYDAMIIGGGVRALAAAMYGQFDTLIKTYQLNSARRDHYLKWARPYHQAVGTRIGYVPGRLYHLWHGDAKNRKYSERHRWFAGFDFEPDADLIIGSNGAWQWARPRPDLEEFFANYFMNRAEDG
jgi:hypothetical protein